LDLPPLRVQLQLAPLLGLPLLAQLPLALPAQASAPAVLRRHTHSRVMPPLTERPTTNFAYQLLLLRFVDRLTIHNIDE
jgi:hypothetical protein